MIELLQFQYCRSWGSNIGRVDSLYCSGSWGYIFQYTPSSTGSVLENIPPAAAAAEPNLGVIRKYIFQRYV